VFRTFAEHARSQPNRTPRSLRSQAVVEVAHLLAKRRIDVAHSGGNLAGYQRDVAVHGLYLLRRL
jgi:hypothetical protein